MIGETQCQLCIHLRQTGHGIPWTCDAFPDGIPKAMIFYQHDHELPYPGDNGVRFEPTPEHAAHVASLPGSDRQPKLFVAEEAAYLNPGVEVYKPSGEGEASAMRRAARQHMDRLKSREQK
jgi:hypothetical protein